MLESPVDVPPESPVVLVVPPVDVPPESPVVLLESPVVPVVPPLPDPKARTCDVSIKLNITNVTMLFFINNKVKNF